MSKSRGEKKEPEKPQEAPQEKGESSVKESPSKVVPSKVAQAKEASRKGETTRTISLEEWHRLEEKASERDHYYDKLLRATAELINYQNRVERERRNWEKAGMVAFLAEVLPVIDNFDRATASAEKSSDVKGLVEGLRLVGDKFHKILEDFSVKPIETVGKAFDPTLHEAVAVEEKSDLPDQTITEELQRGYILDGKVIRPARVRVSKKPEPDETAERPSDKAEAEKG